VRRGFLSISLSSVGKEEVAVGEVLRSAWISTGLKTRQVEQDFAACLGAPGTIELKSCTEALHTAAMAWALELEPVA